MVTPAKLFFCFFFIVLFTFCQTESRKIKFFSKYVHPKEDVLPSSPTPAPQPITSHMGYVPAPQPITSHINYVPAPQPITSHINYVPAPQPITSHIGYVPTPAPQPITSHMTYVPAPQPITSHIGYVPAPQPITSHITDVSTPAPLGANKIFWNSNHKVCNNHKNYYNVDRINYSPMGHELARENNYGEGYYNEEYEKQEGYADVQREFIS
ncbi:hypothetical protein CDL12_27918 [Handroanthus impetiginosus]|uniref:Uncharacterized protein n=1 Tax=Handroanthus impetiginosus TaxID=429701 RepID=A0A2G9G2N8_9LAMI|nr:hypothetical protein CDL12_27918 [Handroanthus impetiginosus]